MELVKMIIKDFKGIRNLEIDFKKRTTIRGKNACGKSTIASAYSWVLFDKDINLVSNPKVVPINISEALPTVTLIFDFDGRPITITKMQKKVTGKPDEDGVSKITISNTYEINSVPKTERDFKAYLHYLGLPETEDMLIASNTEVFTNLKSQDMRSILFSMANAVTDEQIAQSIGNVDDAANLLNNYTLEEIVAMNKASIKKCENQTKSIPDQIVGLEAAKSMIDISELDLFKSSLNKRLEIEKATIKRLEEEREEKTHLRVKALELEFAKNSEAAKVIEKNKADKACFENELSDIFNKIQNAKLEIRQATQTKQRANDSIDFKEKALAVYKKKYDETMASKYDESDNICPCCGQKMPQAIIAKMIKEFDEQRESDLKNTSEDKARIEHELKTLKEVIERSDEKIETFNLLIEKLQSKHDTVSNELEAFKPEVPEETEEYKRIQGLIDDINKSIAELPKYDAEIESHRRVVREINDQIIEVNRKLALGEKNIEIDEQIENLEEKKLSYEQEKADSERILYQVEKITKAKNEELAQDINKNFNIVHFVFFEYLKNGNYRDCCKPLVDGKELGVATNTALELAMKIDICKGIQKYYGVNLPLFVDNAECLDTENLKEIKGDNQLIFLKVTDDALEVVGE